MPEFTTRPVVMGTRGVVASGHYLASAAGLRILMRGGNAIDAAAATGLCLNLLEPHMNGLGGEVPTLIYPAAEKRPLAVSGMGCSPAALTIEWCRTHGIDLIPGEGYLPACVPAVVDTWAAALARFGTMSFADVAAPAIEMAEDGFPVYPSLHAFLVVHAKRFRTQYPTTGAVYLPGGEPPAVGTVLRNPDWAQVLKALCRAERAAAGRGRVAGIEAARDAFYRGEIAERIVAFIHDHPVADASGSTHTGLLSTDDFAAWRATVEEPVTFRYRGLDVHKCPPWTQGPVFLQQLAILEGLDLAAMGHNSADYLHTWIECAKLAFADREAYYGDPAFDDVPFGVLLSADYNARRRQLIGDQASAQMRPGDAGSGVPDYATGFDVVEDNRRALGLAGVRDAAEESGDPMKGDTTHLDVIDAAGNMVSATPSGGWLASSPVIEGLGFPLGTRGQMFYLNPRRPNALAPRKRPRATLTPSLVTRDGQPWMAFGTPGGDSQDQTTLQLFLNVVDFGMNLQQALEAPYVVSGHFPSSFYPRRGRPRQVLAEGRIDPGVIAELRRRGHDVDVVTDFHPGSKATAIRYDAAHRVISGAASPRRQVGYAVGW